MFTNQNNNYQKPQNQNMGGFKPNNKKIPNPANFKIVKCKNYEKGKFFMFCFSLKINLFLSHFFQNPDKMNKTLFIINTF